MARQKFRANLGSAEFPLLSDFYGRTVAVGKQDMHYIRPNAFSGSEADKNIGIPQLVFAENVMPFSAGYQSVAYDNAILPLAATDFDKILYLIHSGTKYLFSPAAGKCYIYNYATNIWEAHVIVIPAGAVCSVANLKQRAFVAFAKGANIYEWDGTSLAAVAVSGIVPSSINGIVAANSYLVAYDDTTIYWSSITNPLDLVPSLETGAGSEKVLALKGLIKYCKPVTDGFIIYSDTNAIYARYSGNTRFPWVYAEILGSSGLSSEEMACDTLLDNKIYVLTDSGLMAYDRIKASQVFPTVSEFLATGMIEQYNYATNAIDAISYDGDPKTKIALIGSRWLVISYAIPTATQFTHALVYDAALQRWGKLRVDHTDVFEFYGDAASTTTNINAVPWASLVGSWQSQANSWADYGSLISTTISANAIPYRSIGFLGNDGRVNVMNFSHTNLAGDGIFYIGRFQFIRDKLTTCLDVEAEGIAANDSNVLNILTSYDGKNIDKVTKPMLVHQKGTLSRWQMRITGINHILRFRGAFRFNTIQLRTMLNGDF